MLKSPQTFISTCFRAMRSNNFLHSTLQAGPAYLPPQNDSIAIKRPSLNLTLSHHAREPPVMKPVGESVTLTRNMAMRKRINNCKFHFRLLYAQKKESTPTNEIWQCSEHFLNVSFRFAHLHKMVTASTVTLLYYVHPLCL